MRDATPRQHLAFARRLRREMTDAERLLWSRLRGHRLAGVAFRRQTPMLGFIVDFVCHAARLVIELDGDQHGRPEGMARDTSRDASFAEAGYSVLRFVNREVFENLDGVVETIYRAAIERMPRHPDHSFWHPGPPAGASVRES